MRRAFDFTVALLALILFTPLFLMVAIAIKATSTGAIFYRARRLGRGGKPFTLYKFRTMKPDKAGPRITRRDDPRITKLGRFLRRTKIDEIPQLLNVVRGDMALVGPRPEDASYLQYYSPEEMRVLSVRPGITSPVSLRFRNEEELLDGAEWHDKYVNVVLHEKLQGELEYLERRTFWSDLGVLLRTFSLLGGR